MKKHEEKWWAHHETVRKTVKPCGTRWNRESWEVCFVKFSNLLRVWTRSKDNGQKKKWSWIKQKLNIKVKVVMTETMLRLNHTHIWKRHLRWHWTSKKWYYFLSIAATFWIWTIERFQSINNQVSTYRITIQNNNTELQSMVVMDSCLFQVKHKS